MSLDGNVDNSDFVVRFVCLGVGFHIGDILHHFHSLHHASEHSVLVVQPGLKEATKISHMYVYMCATC